MNQTINDKSVETLVGGVELEVTHTDGSKETVKVRQIPIKSLGSYLKCFDDESQCAALFCDRPLEWVDTLTNESFEAIIVKGEELNLGFLSRYAERRNKRINGLVPGFQEKILQEVSGQLLNGHQISPAKPE